MADRSEEGRTRTGAEDVARSLRELARQTRELGESTADVASREVSMAVDISTRLRDEVLSEETLEEARKGEITGRIREDAHRMVDLAADTGAVMARTTVKFFERLADETRPDDGGGEPGKDG